MEFLKSKNSFGFNEYFIDQAKDMNVLMYCKDETPPKLVQQSICEKIDKVNNSVYNFAIYDNITAIELWDRKKSLNQGKGFYNYIKRLCFPNTNISKFRYKAESPLLWHNEKYINKELKNVWCYDLNSAYLSILGRGFYPNMEKPLGPGIIRENQIGFSEWCGVIILEEIGQYAEHRFEIAYEEKLVTFAKDKYRLLNEYKRCNEESKKQELKLAIVSAVGIIRNHNIFLYVYIVGSCKKYIQNLINENTLICNTDSIICIGNREDIKIGNNLGEFKIEYQEVDFIYYNSNYQVSKNNKVIYTKYRGIPKPAQENMNFKELIVNKVDYYLEGGQLYGEKLCKTTK